MNIANQLFLIAAEGADETPPNPVIPEVNHLLWALGSFLVLWALMKFVLLPPLLKKREERELKVLEDKQAADRARLAVDQVQADYDASLAQARAEADGIVDEAREQAGKYRTGLMAGATSEAANARANVADELGESRDTAIAGMRDDVGDIAVAAASAVLGKNLNRASNQNAIDAALLGGDE